MVKRIIDWKRQIWQTIFPLFIIPAVLILDAPKRILNFLDKANAELPESEWYWRVVLSLGKWPLIGLALFFLYRGIRKHNKETILKQNLDVIVWHSYFGYWFCRHALNYQTASLTRVPIPVQFQLVWEELFEKYEFMEGVTEKTDSETVLVETFQTEQYTSTVNLLLADTYPLDDWKAKIPASTASYSTIIINRSGERGVRYYSKDYVSKIAAMVHDLPATITDINVFATINAAHVYHIVNEVFKTGGRDGIKRIWIFEQTSGSWLFDGKKYKLIKTGAQ